MLSWTLNDDDDNNDMVHNHNGCYAGGDDSVGFNFSSITDAVQSIFVGGLFGESQDKTPPLASKDANKKSSPPTLDPRQTSMETAETVKFSKLSDQSPEEYLFNFSGGHLIPNPQRRKRCIFWVLVVLLPSAFIAGFYAGRGVQMNVASSANNATAFGMVDSQTNSDKDIITATQSPTEQSNSENADAAQTEAPTTNDENHTPVISQPTPAPQQQRITPSPVNSPQASTISPTIQRVTTNPPVRAPTLPPTTAPSSLASLPTIAPVLPLWVDVPDSETNTVSSGPLIGHTTDRSIKLWAHQGFGKGMECVYRKVGQDNIVTGRILMPPNVGNQASMVQIEHLESSTQYYYEIRIENERVASGHFKTAPAAGSPAEFDYLLTSCMNARRNGYPDQPVWDVVRGEKPLDFAILAGDNVYLNDDDWTINNEILFHRVVYRNLEQRAEPHFAKFVANIPTYSTWDDHDYGRNNADHRQLGKDNSLNAFKSLWPNPSYGTADAPGVFYTYTWGDVQFLVMDCRWYRDHNSDSQFGPAQKEWLFEQLKASTATFKIIVSGTDLVERGFSTDIEEIGNVVDEYKISGVLFNAGDIHRNEFKTMTIGRWPYKVTQITSSGIARVWRRPFALINVNTQLEDPTITAYFYGANSTSLDTTWSNDPSMICTDIASEGDREKEHRCTEVIRLSDLTP